MQGQNKQELMIQFTNIDEDTNHIDGVFYNGEEITNKVDWEETDSQMGTMAKWTEIHFRSGWDPAEGDMMCLDIDWRASFITVHERREGEWKVRFATHFPEPEYDPSYVRVRF